MARSVLILRNYINVRNGLGPDVAEIEAALAGFRGKVVIVPAYEIIENTESIVEGARAFIEGGS